MVNVGKGYRSSHGSLVKTPSAPEVDLENLAETAKVGTSVGKGWFFEALLREIPLKKT